MSGGSVDDAATLQRVVKRVAGLHYGYNAREYRAILAHARHQLGMPNSTGYDWLLRECAAGVYDNGPSHCENALRDQSTNYSRIAPPRRAYALGDAAAHPALDEVNIELLRKLVGTPKELDTLQFLEQPSYRSIVWAVEIWDVRFLQSPRIRSRRAIPPGDYELSASLSRQALYQADGTPCIPWRRFDSCWACNASGSALARACSAALSKCTRAQSMAAYQVHTREPTLLHVDVLPLSDS